MRTKTTTLRVFGTDLMILMPAQLLDMRWTRDESLHHTVRGVLLAIETQDLPV